MTFSVDRTAVDRAGGIARLASIADSLVGKAYAGRVIETASSLRLVVDAFPEELAAERRYVEVSPDEVELATVILSSSAAVRVDQRTLAEEDLAALSAILDAEVERRTFDRLPELEKRALGGDR